MKKNLSGIYKITIGEWFYYGSSNDIRRRGWGHKYSLKNNKHCNTHMQRVYNKYNTFKIECVEEVNNNEDLIIVEQKYLDQYVGTDNCLNLNVLANGSFVSPEKQAKSLNAMREANTGAKRTEESRKRMSEAAKNRYKDPEQKKLLKDAAEAARNRRWERDCKPFVLVKDGKEYGPYRTCHEVDILSHPSVLDLKNGKKESVKGFTFKFIKK